jgi:hypothetical protein
MSRTRPSPIVLTPQQQVHSWRSRADTLRRIAATSRDPTARRVLLERAETWEKRVVEVENAWSRSKTRLRRKLEVLSGREVQVGHVEIPDLLQFFPIQNSQLPMLQRDQLLVF